MSPRTAKKPEHITVKHARERLEKQPPFERPRQNARGQWYTREAQTLLVGTQNLPKGVQVGFSVWWELNKHGDGLTPVQSVCDLIAGEMRELECHARGTKFLTEQDRRDAANLSQMRRTEVATRGERVHTALPDERLARMLAAAGDDEHMRAVILKEFDLGQKSREDAVLDKVDEFVRAKS